MTAVISAVVPTHDRPDGLARLLRALAAQTLDPDRVEIIVVDDGSQPRAQASAARVLRHERPLGPAAARNRGWRAASAPLVAFVDDDCVPTPEWLAEIVRTADGAGDAIVQGPVAPLPSQARSITPLSHTVRVESPSVLCISCNVAYARALLERTGGFDERFRRASGEDAELGVRAVAAGGRIRWAPGALVHHEVRTDGLWATLRRTARSTDSVRALALQPELREVLFARLFWRPSHPLLLLALAGAATRRPLLGLAATVPYLRHYRRIDGARGLVRWLPVRVTIDGAEVLTAVAGSLRHGTVML